MRVIQFFLFIYFCYAHDLHHADPVSVKQSEPTVPIDPITKNIETTNVQKNQDTVETRFQSTHDLKKPIQESHSKQQATPSVDKLNDLPSTQKPTSTETPPPSVAPSIKNIPTINEKTNPKIIQNDPVITQSQNIPSPKNSNTLNQPPPSQVPTKPTESITKSPSTSTPQAPQKPAETVAKDTVTIQNESRITPPPPQVQQKPAEPIVRDTSTVQNEPRTTPSPPPQVQQQPTIHPRHIPINQQQTESISKTETTTISQIINEPKQSTQTSTETTINLTDENDNLKSLDILDHPRQVHVHDSLPILDQPEVLTIKEDSNKSENLTISTNSHLPRIVENLETITINTSSQIEPKIEDENNSTTILTNNDTLKMINSRQICWHLPKTFEPSIELLENQIFRFINILPDFLQTIFFGRIEDREILMNTMWFSSICTMCFLFSFFFLSMGAKRLKQSKHEKEIRIRCQQLQQYNNQIELERATFERQNQKLSDEIDELKNIPVRDADEDIFALREECIRFQEDLKTVRLEKDTLQQEIDQKQSLILKHEFDLQRQIETVAYLNNENLQLKQDLEKDRNTISRLQTNDLSLERFEKTQETIQELKSEITQLKQEKFSQKDQLQQIQEQYNQLDIEKNQLTIRMKQLKTLLEQRDQTIKNIQQKINDENTTDFEDLLPVLHSDNSEDLLSTVNNDIEKSNQHMQNLHNEIEEKSRRINELDLLLKQARDQCKEIETKLKVVLELRERDAHIHIRQLGQTDAELRKARTDTDRVRILQQQLELKQQQLDDVQKVLSSEQVKFNEECSKLQHETHEKWMEVKRLMRELDASKKECEGLRRQITKYANNEKNVIKPVPQFIGNTGESETNGSSPVSYQQVERPIDHQRNDSGATSPSEMFLPRPPMFGQPRPPFFPPPFMGPPFMLPPRFPMPPGGPPGMLSPMSHIIINGNDANNSDIIDTENITPNSDAQLNGGGVSPATNDKKPAKAKKSLKKKTRISVAKEEV